MLVLVGSNRSRELQDEEKGLAPQTSQLLRRLLRTRLGLLPRRMVRLIRHQMSHGRHLIMWVERRVRDDGDRRVGGARLHHRGWQRIFRLSVRALALPDFGRCWGRGRLATQRLANFLELLAEIVV